MSEMGEVSVPCVTLLQPLSVTSVIPLTPCFPSPNWNHDSLFSWPSCSNEAAALHLLLKAQMLVRSPCLPVTQAITDEMRE